ncbi:hypothetical protein AB0P37_45390, partial [Streptomyces antimycoticus]
HHKHHTPGKPSLKTSTKRVRQRHTTPESTPENGQLYHCLQHREPFDENTAFPTELAAAA